MKITAATRISTLIKANPASIEVIAGINKHFEKLRNPILRKILAPRITILDAAKIGGCKIEDFFSRLVKIGFELDQTSIPEEIIQQENLEMPAFMKEVKDSTTSVLDVRIDILSGKDPFQKIMQFISEMPQGNILHLINSFEPIPLIKILNKKGFEHYTKINAAGTTSTYLKKIHEGNFIENTPEITPNDPITFESKLRSFEGKLKEINVKGMEMPMPMITILNEIENISEGNALYVHHKKIPQYLFPELEERRFKWMINEIREGDVKLLIYK